METRKLEHLLELAATASFSRAAANLHLTQSALSKSIQSLEEEIGAQLVDRRGRHCALTAIGEMVAERARRLLPEVDEVLHLAERDSNPEGMLRVGFGAGPGAAICPGFIRHVAESYPRVRLVIRRGTVQALMRELRERTIDVLMLDVRALRETEDLVVEPVGSLLGGAVSRAPHPLASEASITMEKLLDYPVLSTSVSDEIARTSVEMYGPKGDPRRFTTVESEELEPLVKAAVTSNAVFLGVIAAAQDEIGDGRAQVLVLSPPLHVKVPIALVRLSSKAEMRLVFILRNFVSAWLKESAYADSASS